MDTAKGKPVYTLSSLLHVLIFLKPRFISAGSRERQLNRAIEKSDMPWAYHRADTHSTIGFAIYACHNRAVLSVFPWSVRTAFTNKVAILPLKVILPYRINISNALTLGLPHDLKLKKNEINVALAVFYVSYVIFEVPSNLLLRRLKPHVWRKYSTPSAGWRHFRFIAYDCIYVPVSGCTFAFGLVNMCHGFRMSTICALSVDWADRSRC